ncbi:MAG: hypothetical protein ABSE17_03700 [Candidatus Levyibacteriota bacterium]|jgi:DNA-binding protein H-NS
MAERLIISPEVTAALREGRAAEKAARKAEVSFGLWGEALGAEGIRPSRMHSSGATKAKEAQQF